MKLRTLILALLTLVGLSNNISAQITLNSNTQFKVQDGTQIGLLKMPLASTSGVGMGLISNTDYQIFSGKLSGLGTVNYIPKFVSGTSFTNSNITDDGNTIKFGANNYFDVLNNRLGINGTPYYTLSVYSTDATYTSQLVQPSTNTAFYNVNLLSGNNTPTIGYYGIGGSTVGNVHFRNSFCMGTQNNYPFKIMQNDAARMVFTGGFVGIENLNPTRTLDIGGSFRTTGVAEMGSDASIAGELTVGGYRTFFTNPSPQLRLGNQTPDGTWTFGVAGSAARDFFIYNSNRSNIDLLVDNATGETRMSGNTAIQGKACIGCTGVSSSFALTVAGNYGIFVNGDPTGVGQLAQFGGRGDFNINSVGAVGGRFKVADNGNVGVGIHNGLEKLNVKGSISVHTDTGVDGNFGDALIYGYSSDLVTGAARRHKISATLTGGAAANNIMKFSVWGGGNGTNPPTDALFLYGTGAAKIANTLDMSSTNIINVAAGVNSTDAVNVTQLNSKLTTVSTTANLTGQGTSASPLDLANSGVTAGRYDNVVVDAKGRVASGVSNIFTGFRLIPTTVGNAIEIGKLNLATNTIYYPTISVCLNEYTYGSRYYIIPTSQTYPTTSWIQIPEAVKDVNTSQSDAFGLVIRRESAFVIAFAIIKLKGSATTQVNFTINGISEFDKQLDYTTTSTNYASLSYDSYLINKKYLRKNIPSLSSIDVSANAAANYSNLTSLDFSNRTPDKIRVVADGVEYDYSATVPTTEGAWFTISGTTLKIYSGTDDITSLINSLKIILE